MPRPERRKGTSESYLNAVFVALVLGTSTCTKATNARIVVHSAADLRGRAMSFVSIVKPRWNRWTIREQFHRRTRVSTAEGRWDASVGCTSRNVRPRMDFGELDGIMQTVLSPTNEPARAGFQLDPAQCDAVLLPLDTPAILLTAGAGTGKTHTLAARLARILGVEPQIPAELRVETRTAASTGAEAGVEHVDLRHAFGDDGAGHESRGGGGCVDGRVAAGAAAPESVLVISFTKQGAQDVRERAKSMGVPRAQADRVWTATFHSFAATVLQQHHHLLWAESSPMWPRFASGLNIVSHAQQVDLVASLLGEPRGEERDSQLGSPAPFYCDEHAFKVACSAASGGRSWGMPPTQEEREQKAARRRIESKTRAKTVLSRITLWKEKGITVEDIRSRNVQLDDHTDSAAASIYSSYQQQLRNRRQVDFGDLCIMTTDLFARHPEVLERYRWRLRHVIVDEFQDTSPAQQRLLQALVTGIPSARIASRGPSTSTTASAAVWPDWPTRFGEEETRVRARGGVEPARHPGLGVSLFCAGDEDQHIYGWRGTTVEHLHRFEEDFVGAVRCGLTETHRLPVHLLRSATGLMRAGGLVPLLNRRMRTKQHNPGAVVRAQGLWNSREEGKWVSLEARKMNLEQGISYKDMAVIARTAYNTRELEESLAARGIPYTVQGGSSFFSRPELQAPLALLALCANPQDDAAFRRFVALRPRTRLLDWATSKTIRGVGDLAIADGVSFAEGVRRAVSRGHMKEEGASNFIYGLRRWSSLLMGWPKLHETERGAAVWRIFWEGGFLPRPIDASFAFFAGQGTDALGSSKMTKEEEAVSQLAIAASRCGHVGRFLLRAARAREEAANQHAAARESRGRGGRWEGKTGNERQPLRLSEDSIEMMTMHQAKGKEFKVVFLTGWDEGSFPVLPNSGDGDHVVESLDRLQEERRLGYVALTRASENAIITFSKKRRFKNAWITSSGPSRFLLEMPADYVEVMPDAIGRILNDYPGMAGSHRLAFDGLLKAGKLRRSRAVLPAKGKLGSSSRDTSGVGGDSGLPHGCTVVNRNSPLTLTTTGEGTVVDDFGKRRMRTVKPSVRMDENVGVVVNGTEPSFVGTTQPRWGSSVAGSSTLARESASATQFSRMAALGGSIGSSSRLVDGPCEQIAGPPMRYNPGPFFRETRGRKKKALLDPSEVTEDSIFGEKELTALLEDTNLQQASLKNYLRAVLAIQHGCSRGSIPVWRPTGGKQTRKAAAAYLTENVLRGGLVESEATGRAALSTCSARDLASYIAMLIEAKRRRTERRSRHAIRSEETHIARSV